MKTTGTLVILLIVFSLNAFAQHAFYTSPEREWGSINSVAFSPDGRTFASGGADRTVRLWDASGALKRTFTEHEGRVLSVAFSPDGQILASGSDDETIRLWDVNTGKHLYTLREYESSVYSVAFSPDGQTFAGGSYYGTVHLWDTNTGEHLKTFAGRIGSIWSIAFSPDGQTLIGADNFKIHLWDVSTGERKRVLEGQWGSVSSVAFSPDGQKFASGSYADKIHLWDISTGKNFMTLTGHADKVNSVAFSPDGRTLVCGSRDDTIRLWDINTGENFMTLTEHTDKVNSVAFSPDGRTLVSGSHDDTIRLWDINTGENLKTLTKRWGSFIYSVAFSPDGQTLASRIADGTIRLWDINTGEQTQILPGHEGMVWSVAFSPDGRILASGSGDRTIRLWDVNTGKPLKTLSGHEGTVRSVAFSPDGRILASGSWDRTIRLWDVNTGKPLKTLAGNESSLSSIAFSPDGQILASGSLGRTLLRLWDVNTGEPLKTLIGHKGTVRSVAFSPDGRILASGSDDKTIRLWDVNTGENLKTLTDRNPVSSIAFSPDGQILASGSWNDTVRLWDANIGEPLKTLTGHAGSVWGVAFSPDGQTLASGSTDGAIRLWGLQFPARVHITPKPVVSPPIGEQFTINVNIIAGENVGGYQVGLRFDTAVIRYVESTNGDYLPTGAFFVPPVISGNRVTLGATALAGISNRDGTLATVTFEVVDVKESVIQLFDTILTDSDGEHLSHLAYDAKVEEPSLLPSSAIISITPFSVLSPAVGEQLTFNIGIAGGRNVADFQLTVYSDQALRYISSTPGNYLAGGVGNGDGTLETVTFEVLGVKTSTVSLSGYLVAPNGLRYLPTFKSAEIIVPLLGDVNRDGVVNILDLVQVASKFGQRASGDPADVNEDGVVNIVDLVKVAGALGDGAAAPSAWHFSSEAMPTRADVQQWLSQAQHLNLTDPTSQRGILFLEQLLATLTPKETTLLPNYPNPFNPETWIPYQLAAPADVTLTIYAVDGGVVRTLTLGHQSVGIYQGKSRAAYWDGKNALGEPVASGVYFYTLTAGKFAATRKMLIRK